jgi:GntR family transcriptional repressor for pyruvate dehydrogenase complex
LPSERELAARLGVSRATLREAMVALRQAGFVETTRGRSGGTIVTLRPASPSARKAARFTAAQRADWLDSLAFRRVVEPGAAELAAGTELDDVRRQQLVDAQDAVVTATTRAGHRQADSRFHLTVAALSASPRVIEAVASVQATLHEMLSAIPVLETQHRAFTSPTRAPGQGHPGRSPRRRAHSHARTLRRHRRAAARIGGVKPCPTEER